jgi:hypothetical protein
MSVIGRLDEQTEAVLITPLGKRSRTGSGPQAQDERPHDGAESSSDTKRRTPGDAESSEDDSKRPGELPVWLL